MAESERPLFTSIRSALSRIRPRFPWPRPVIKPVADEDTLAEERLRVQVKVIRNALDDEVVGANDRDEIVEDDAEVHYLFHPGRGLVRDGDDYETLRSFIEDRDDERFQAGLERIETLTDGLVLVGLPSRSDRADPVLQTLRELDDEVRPELATPDHVLYLTPRGSMCPATEPEEPSASHPVPAPTADQSAGSGVPVSVVDSGWWAPAGTSKATSWLSGVDGDHENVNPQDIHTYAGHGTFVSGVLRCLAPKTEIWVEGILPDGGAVYESAICRELEQALTRKAKPKLISISAGTHTRKAFNLISLEVLAANHGFGPEGEGLIVAAAGNDYGDRPFYPAAFRWVVGVGAVEPDGGGVCDFSNVGDWVDVYARGRNLVNAFPNGTYKCTEPENIHSGVPDVRKFNGLAQWSGTSFSTPIVTGLIAARMSANPGESARQAYETIVQATPFTKDPRAGQIKIVGPMQ